MRPQMTHIIAAIILTLGATASCADGFQRMQPRAYPASPLDCLQRYRGGASPMTVAAQIKGK